MKRLTPWLFALTVTLWLGGMLSTRWLSRPATKLSHTVAAEYVHGASSVVVVAPADSEHGAEGPVLLVQFSPDAALVATVESDSLDGAASVRPERQGAVLYLHVQATQANPELARQSWTKRPLSPPRLRVLELPLTITELWVQGAPTRVEIAGQMPTLRLQGQDVYLSSGSVGELHVVNQVTRKDEEICAQGRGSPQVVLDLENVSRVRIETVGGQLLLRNTEHVQALHLVAPPSTSLEIDHLGSLRQLHWQPMSAERLQALSLPCQPVTPVRVGPSARH